MISPIVRRLAREHGLDLAALRGSGPGGLVRRADVENALAVAAAPQPSPTAAPADVGRRRPGLVIPLTGIRRAIAEKLSRSRREIPEVTIWVDVDATALLETRAAINAARPDRPVSVLALLARICLRGLGRYPQLNARVDTAGERIVQSAGVHLGIATQTDRGLLVPVLRDAQRLDAGELAERLRETDRRGPGRHADARPADRWHVHPQQLRRLRGRRLHADPQPSRGGDARHRADRRPSRGSSTISWPSGGWRSSASPSTTGSATAASPAGSCGYVADRVEQPALLIAEL